MPSSPLPGNESGVFPLLRRRLKGGVSRAPPLPYFVGRLRRWRSDLSHFGRDALWTECLRLGVQQPNLASFMQPSYSKRNSHARKTMRLSVSRTTAVAVF